MLPKFDTERAMETIKISKEAREEMLTDNYCGRVSMVSDILGAWKKAVGDPAILSHMQRKGIVDEDAQSCDLEQEAEEAQNALTAFIDFSVHKTLGIAEIEKPKAEPKTLMELGRIVLNAVGEKQVQKGYRIDPADVEEVGRQALYHGDINADGTLN